MNVYISHAAADSDFARRLASALQERGVGVWSAAEIRAGDDFANAIAEAVASADAVVPVVSRASMGSPGVAAELAMAVAYRLEGGRKRIVPVLAEPSAEAPFFLRDLQLVDLSDETKFEQNINELLRGLPSNDRPPSAIDVLRTRGEWVKAQQSVLKAELEALESARQRQFRYVTVILVVASTVGLIAALSFAGLRRLDDPSLWVLIAASLVSFIAGLATSHLTRSVFEARKAHR